MQTAFVWLCASDQNCMQVFVPSGAAQQPVRMQKLARHAVMKTQLEAKQLLRKTTKQALRDMDKADQQHQCASAILHMQHIILRHVEFRSCRCIAATKSRMFISERVWISCSCHAPHRQRNSVQRTGLAPHRTAQPVWRVRAC